MNYEKVAKPDLDELKSNLKYYQSEICKNKMCYRDFILNNNKLKMYYMKLKDNEIFLTKVKKSADIKCKTVYRER